MIQPVRATQLPRTGEGYAAAMQALNDRCHLVDGMDFLEFGRTLATMDSLGGTTAQKRTWLRNYRTLMTVEEKRAAGLSTRIKIGAEFYAMLTATGRMDPQAAAAALAHCGSKAYERAAMRLTCLHSGMAAELLIIDDAKTCEAARALRGAVVPNTAIPAFPLAGCDQWMCRCGFHRAMPRVYDAPRRRSEFRNSAPQVLPSPGRQPITPRLARILRTLLQAMKRHR